MGFDLDVPVSMFFIRAAQDWFGKLQDRPSQHDEADLWVRVEALRLQDEEDSTPSPQSGAYIIEKRRVHTTALRLDW